MTLFGENEDEDCKRKKQRTLFAGILYATKVTESNNDAVYSLIRAKITMLDQNCSGSPRRLRSATKMPISALLNPDKSPKQKRKRVKAKCSSTGCTKLAKTGGKCNSHGGGHICQALDCKNFAGGKRCSVEGCIQGAKVNHLCWKHGGHVQCKTKDCGRGAKTGGLCWKHGGGKSCQIDGCTKVALKGSRCWAHGGGKRCVVVNCDKACIRSSDQCRFHTGTETSV